MESKIAKPIAAKNKVVVPGVRVEMGGDGVLFSSGHEVSVLQMSKFWRSKVQHCDYRKQYYNLCLKFTKKMDHKFMNNVLQKRKVGNIHEVMDIT